MDQKKNSEQTNEFCEAVDTQMKMNKEFHEKVKKERILKNDSKEQVLIRKISAKPSKVSKSPVLQKSNQNKNN